MTDPLRYNLCQFRFEWDPMHLHCT
eukprot:COSAG05_NODE_825_length_7106_cov_74.690881_17_plen_24_part_01